MSLCRDQTLWPAAFWCLPYIYQPVLHKALKSIENKVDAYDADFLNELSAWIAPELENHNVSFNDGLVDDIAVFLSRDYKTLPRQLIHRDVHTSNLIFVNGMFHYVDFDMIHPESKFLLEIQIIQGFQCTFIRLN